MSSQPYLEQIERVLPRLLAIFDMDPLKATYGIGDRYHWAWKLIDFGNGTFQGAAHGLAHLMKNSLLPDWVSSKAIIRRIDAIFHGTKALTRKNGSMEEAFPYESSFCVTALVAFDLLSTCEILKSEITENKIINYLLIIKPLIEFLFKVDEKHAFISNHLATAAAALYKWKLLTGDNKGEIRGSIILDKILLNQSSEGWFKEYEGADPGYQSLCTYYLADISRFRPDLNLDEPLRKSVQFLWHFAHPDGSFGGVYGSRNTRFYYPAGIEYLSNIVPEANVLADFMRDSIKKRTAVTLETMDAPNLVPMFNAYCQAAVFYEKRKKIDDSTKSNYLLPAIMEEKSRIIFKEAGIIIDRDQDHYTIISTHKGGVVYHYTNHNHFIDCGVVINKGKKYFSNQAYQTNIKYHLEVDHMSVTSTFSKMHHEVPSSFQFIIMRLLNVTFMRNVFIGNVIKRILVWLLITGKKPLKLMNKRTIKFGENIDITDEFVGESKNYSRIVTEGPFSEIHMASQGYWQIQDEKNINA